MITGGRTQARDEVFTLLKAVTDTLPSVEVIWQDELKDVPVTQVTLGIHMQHLVGTQASLAGGEDCRRWESTGQITVEIRCPVRVGGLTASDAMSTMIENALRGKSTPNGVWFRNVVGREVPPKDGNARTEVGAEFIYQEIR